MDTWKFDILDDFTHRDKNVKLELKSNCDRTESTIRRIWEVGIQILDFIWVSLLFCYSFVFIEKRDIKSWFLKFKLFW